MTQGKAKAIFLERLQLDDQQARQALAAFKTEFEKDPWYAFHWGVGSFRAAAQLNVIRELRLLVDKVSTLELVREHAEHRLRQRASDTSSHGFLAILDRYEVQAWAEYAEHLKYYVVEPEVTP